MVVSVIVNAQELPPIQNYGIDDYEAGNQNWAISQSQDKYIYVGNNHGLLEFDGARWTLYPSPNGTIIRAMEVIGDRVYTGCYMELGYWKRNDLGGLEYTSLLDKLKQPLIVDEHFWNITVHDEWVLFQSVDRVYLYDTKRESFEVIDFNVQRAKIFNLGSEILVQKNTGGLYRIRNGKAILESEHPIFKNNFIVGIYNHQGRKIIITEKGRFYFYDGSSIKEWKTDINRDDVLYLYSTLQLTDGSYILGTISNGYIHMDKSGEVIQRVNQESGLANNTVLSLFEDVDKNLWLGLDNGISNINLESAFRIYTDSKGELGVVYASLLFEGYLYLGTNQGLYCRKLNSSDDFTLVKGTKGQVWSLSIIDNKLFCAHTMGTLIVKNQKALHIYDQTGTWLIEKVDGNDHLLIQGNYNGLSVLEKKDGQWKYRNKIEGFEISSRSVVVAGRNRVIVNHEYKGLYNLEIDSSYTKIKKSNFEDHIGFDSSVLKYDDIILYTSSEGVFELDLETSSLSKSEFWDNVFYSEGNKIQGRLVVERKNNKIWGFSEKNVICMSIDDFDGTPKVNEVAIPSFFRRNQGIVGYENVSQLNDGIYIIGTSDGYALLDLNKFVDTDADYSIRINAVSKGIMHADYQPISLKGDLSHPYEHSNWKFFFSVPEYDKYKEIHYQYQLNGYLDRWSKWFTEPSLMFANLPHGSYDLIIRARIGNKLSENTASYSFTIKKPWYFSIPALAFYFLVTLLLMWGIHKAYRQNYMKHKQRLMDENRRKMERTQLESEREIVKLKNQQLKKDIEAKNKELASTAMSLINKNELLNGIKNDLLHIKDKSSRDEVVRVINKNLNNSSDWEFFQKAFDHADKDFLTKIKTVHPELTANDLKFCAYLRLNLSSKEIAPLLNISVRSVEIKRYRLRKKLGISHEMNLIDYILEV